MIDWLRNKIDRDSIIYKLLRVVHRTLRLLVEGVIYKIVFSRRYKLFLLSTWYDTDKRTKVDSFLFPIVFNQWIKLEYLKESDPDRRERLKSLAMGGNSGEKWAQEYNSRPLNFKSRIGNMGFLEALPAFDELEGLCLDSLDDKAAVIQIGSSSGREIAYFADRFPKCRFIGTDIYEGVVSYSARSYNLPNLRFELCSAAEIESLLDKNRCSRIFIFSSGSLQYVQPEHLKLFFGACARYSKLRVVLSEPANELQGNPRELKTSIWRGNFSYTHDYAYYAESVGIETVNCRIVRPYVPYVEFPMHRGTVLYFYSGRTK